MCQSDRLTGRGNGAIFKDYSASSFENINKLDVDDGFGNENESIHEINGQNQNNIKNINSNSQIN